MCKIQNVNMPESTVSSFNVEEEERRG